MNKFLADSSLGSGGREKAIPFCSCFLTSKKSRQWPLRNGDPSNHRRRPPNGAATGLGRYLHGPPQAPPPFCRAANRVLACSSSSGPQPVDVFPRSISCAAFLFIVPLGRQTLL